MKYLAIEDSCTNEQGNLHLFEDKADAEDWLKTGIENGHLSPETWTILEVEDDYKPYSTFIPQE